MTIYPQYPYHIIRNLSLFPSFIKIERIYYGTEYFSVIGKTQKELMHDNFDISCTFYNKNREIIECVATKDYELKNNRVIGRFRWPGYQAFKIRPKVQCNSKMNVHRIQPNKKNKISDLFTSIIIPVKNQSIYLDFVLKGFLYQSLQPNSFEIIVINDHSTDDLIEVIEKYYNKLNIRLIDKISSFGRSAARNKGIQAAGGDIIIFLDADCIPYPDFLKDHLDLQKKNSCISIGQRLSIKPESIENLFYKNFLDFKSLICKSIRTKCNYDKRVEWYLITNNLLNECFPWIFFTTCNASIPIGLGKSIEFDERFKGWGYEDTDYAWRLYLHDSKLPVLPCLDALVFHIEHPRNLYAEGISASLNKKILTEKFLTYRDHLY